MKSIISMSSHQVLHWAKLEFEQALLVLESVSNYEKQCTIFAHG